MEGGGGGVVIGWAEAAEEFGDAEVLDDDGIDAGAGDAGEVIGGGGEFVGEDEGVEGDEAFDVVAVEIVHDFW